MSNQSSSPEAFECLWKSFQSQGATHNENADIWLKSFRDKLFTMLQTPLKPEYSREVFKWVSSFCLSIGDFSWISSNRKWTCNEAKMFSLIARLSMNEILIVLPLIHRHLTCSEDIEREDGKIMARSADESEYDAYGDHLIILESTIISLVKNQDGDEETGARNCLTDCISPEELRNLLQRLKEAMSEICDYLSISHRYWERLVGQPESHQFSAMEASLRIMSLWLSEDPGSFDPECKSFLIDLLLNNLSVPDRYSNRDIYMTALHAICTQNGELLDVLRDNPNHRESLQKYLDHVQKEQEDSDSGNRRVEKKFKLRCGLVRDLMSMMQQH